MNVQQRKELLVRLGAYMKENGEEWQGTKNKAASENNWFVPEFIELAVRSIADHYLTSEALQSLMDRYQIPFENPSPKKVGIVMAGNIPLVGFHDLLCVFLTGHVAVIKPSSKDEALVKQLVKKLIDWESSAEENLVISERIPNCDAYIATGSNNSSRYFEYYFQKYPSIIRRNRTSVAILHGKETLEDLERLADDVYQYFGLGCRNVTQLYVPKNYDFLPLLEAFKKYDYLANHHKYKNNYDYYLAIHILNNRYYMTNGSIILVEDASPFSGISQIHYQFYTNREELMKKLNDDQNIQCIVGKDETDFGGAQCPGVCDFADRVDTMDFLLKLG